MLIWVGGACIILLTAVAFFVTYAMKKPRTLNKDKTLNYSYRYIQSQHRVLSCQAFEENLSQYKALLKRNPNDIRHIFWDIVVITTVDSNQKSATEKLINLSIQNDYIPFSNYVVIADPVGPKVGNGGSMLNVLDTLRNTFGMETIKTKKVLLIQAGGYSQRLPSCSALGKLSMGIPIENKSHLYQMLELALIYLLPFASRMSPGILHVCSDTLISFVSKGDWKFDKEGFTTFGILCDIKTGVSHGVLDFEDRQELWERQLKIVSNPNEPTVEIKKCTQFLHKISAERLREHKVVHSVNNEHLLEEYTYMDSNYYFCWKTAEKLIQFYDQIGRSVQVELDAYADFLKASISNGNMDYIYDVGNAVSANNKNYTNNLIEMRKLVNKALTGIPIYVAVMNVANYLHLGTSSEYLEHYVRSDIFSNSENGTKEKVTIFSASPNVFVGIQQQQELNQNIKVIGKRYRLMQCLLIPTAGNESIKLGTSTVVESSYIESGVTIGNNCLVSYCYLASSTVIPDNTYIFSIAVNIPERDTSAKLVMGYITVVFGINDALKKLVSSDMWENLTYLDGQISLGQIANKMFLNYVDVNENNTQLHYARLFSEGITESKMDATKKVGLWDAKLFPVMKDIKESCAFAIKRLNTLLSSNTNSTNANFPIPPVGDVSLSMADTIKCKDTDVMFDYMAKLKECIQNNSS